MFFNETPLNLTLSVNRPTYLVAYYYINGTTCVFINCFGCYCILKRSPSEMKQYKWFLLNICVGTIIFYSLQKFLFQFWAFFLDILLNFVSQPITFFPLNGGCSISSVINSLPDDAQYILVVHLSLLAIFLKFNI